MTEALCAVCVPDAFLLQLLAHPSASLSTREQKLFNLLLFTVLLDERTLGASLSICVVSQLMFGVLILINR